MDDRRLAGIGGDGEETVEKAALRVARRVVAEVVEAGLPHADRTRMGEERAHLAHVVVVDRAGLVRMDAEDRRDPGVPLGKLERATAAGDGRADGEDAADARVVCARDCRVGVVERVEVRVGVDHAAAAGVSTRGKSGGAGAMPSAGSAV